MLCIRFIFFLSFVFPDGGQYIWKLNFSTIQKLVQFFYLIPNIFVYETWAGKGVSEGCWWTLYSVKKCWIFQKAIIVLWAIFSGQNGPDCTYLETYIASTSVSKIHRWLMAVWPVRAYGRMNFKALKLTEILSALFLIKVIHATFLPFLFLH